MVDELETEMVQPKEWSMAAKLGGCKVALWEIELVGTLVNLSAEQMDGY